MSERRDTHARPQRVAVVTGTRAEFGLLTPVMRAIEAHPRLELRTIVTGSHLLGPAFTSADVERLFPIDAEVPMQRDGASGRLEDAAALGRGIERMAPILAELRPDWVIVLGDRIEALAGATAASVGGVPVGHVHGGDRAEGIADESIRHAITKLAHVHFAATDQSAERIARMGEDAWRIHTVGSPAIDGLTGIEPLSDEAFEELGSPRAVFLTHPEHADDETERLRTLGLLSGLLPRFGSRLLCLHPNFDAGREGVLRAIEEMGAREGLVVRDHLVRETFIGLLRRLARDGGAMIGNSSAGLIEAAALGLPVVDVGARQAGRERPGNVIHADGAHDLADALERALSMDRRSIEHPYGDGGAGERIAGAIDTLSGRDRGALLRKRCVY